MEDTPKRKCGCEVYEVCPQCEPETHKRLSEEMERDRHGSSTFYSLLEEMADTHDKKSHDYASNENPFGNYHFAGQVSSMFSHSPQDAGFAGRIAEKIYRLANLGREQKTPLNESIADTERDIAVITTLWMADRRDRRLNQNREELNKFAGDSRAMRNELIPAIGRLTPNDLEIVYTYIVELMRLGHGVKHVNAEPT